ncbi:MAG TPA: glycosyltransferase family 2 protein [Thermoanaerobaculia bacterium]|nr:glycosyltransferase family 2 protein [Thermoanaerobaculia bacterium]
MSLVLATSLLLGAGFFGLALRTEERRRQAPELPGPLLPAPETTVLLPIRDERHNVLDCVETLLGQTAAPRVRVIDDGSADGSGELVAARAVIEPRLALLAAGPLPPGWRGKVHALWAGAQGATAPWLLTTDADTRHAPDLLARAHAAAAKWGLDAVSLAGTQEVRGLGENLLVPPVFALLDALLADWEGAAAGAGPPVANGQLILLRRAAWEACGGFEAVRNEAIDDVATISRLRAGGFRTGFLRAAGLRVRMYRGWREAFRGWRRNLGGLLGPSPRTVATALAVLLLPVAALVTAVLAGLAVEATLLWGAGAAASMLLRSGGSHRPAWGLLYPLDVLALAAVLALGTRDRRRGRLSSWKGREMRV